MSELQARPFSMRAAWSAHVHAHPYAAVGLAIAALGTVTLFCSSLYNAFTAEAHGHLRYALLGGTAGFAATALGALVAVSLRRLSTEPRTACWASRPA